jgi:hypothetical protein
MSLSELMSSMDLAVYPQVALVIFLAVFASVTWRIFTQRGREECRAMAVLPLEEDPAGRAAPARPDRPN